ncbi:SDR family NAD(P)-dependent oxidoreductase [Myroides sp. LoEW2-1]|uniref:SDR family NAD(P)-dependent oxidoreductase n=1 Tax=Myroides sp. LoEW2-1 TaxID=2683192 RepID=UPI00132789FA|nr:SDR family oxidoreductase [Myroides sp. LoEW2-1]MVX35992.1 SDR family oxidoreductase [Myroides sp. LoEW2-1]
MKQLENKVAIITGAASGIGKCVAELFVKEGAKVAIVDWNEAEGKKVVSTLGENAIFIKADAGKAQDHERVVQETVAAFGQLDIAVNNAGIVGAFAVTGEYGVEDWDKVISINLNGVFYGMRYQLPEMLKKGKGSIINVSSILAEVGVANSSAYCAAKHGVNGLTKTAAWEYGTKGIRINAVGPGYIGTPLVTESYSDEVIKELSSRHAMNRLGKPEEVAELILWLATDKSSFSTGAYYPVDGGYLAR